jgi:hypothetical protein
MSTGGIIVRLVAALLLAGSSGGCTTISINDGQALQGHYIGLVSVRIPEGQSGMTAVEAKNFGASFTEGVNLGWSSQSLVNADPAGCQIMIIVKSAAQLTNVQEIAKGLKGEKLCLADFDTSLSR